MITIKHTCGHTTGTTVDTKFGERGDVILARIGKTREQFVKEQVEFLESNACPTCYVPRYKRSALDNLAQTEVEQSTYDKI